MRLIAARDSRRAFEVRDLLERNLLPVHWYDADTDDESAAMLEWLDIPRSETPVLVHATNVMRNPSAAQVARSLGLRAEVDGQRFDLVVLGAGPAGLAAAVYGGSEGLRTFVAEAWAPGGQAGTSTRIENYLGFPTGISGTELTRKATLQARRFDAVLSSFHRAVELADGPEGLVRVDLDDGQHVLGRSVVMATGARWRELQAEGIDRFRGAGVYHAAMATDAERCRDEDVIVVGGGNSAGQAAVHLASRARSVRIVVRGKALKSTMSHYLVDRIERSTRIEVMTETEVAAVHGTATVESVSLRNGDGSVRQVPSTAVFVMIGAAPCTEATTGMLAVDAAGYLLCGAGAAKCDGHLGWPLHGPRAASPRDGPPGRVRRRRRALRSVEARGGRGRRRRDGRALRARRARRLNPPSASSQEKLQDVALVLSLLPSMRGDRMARGWIHTVWRSATSDWANEVEGGDRASSVHATRNEAVKRGRDLAIAAKTEHLIHNQDGTIAVHNSYGKDP